MNFRPSLTSRKGLWTNYLEWGLGNQSGGGHRGKSQLEKGGLDVKINTYRGDYFFHSFSQTRKVVEKLLEFNTCLHWN